MPIFIDTTGLYGDTAKTQPAPLPAGISLGGAGVVEFGDGSAASPSIRFTSDTNTGIFRKAADSLGFAEGGVEVGSYDSAGSWILGSTGSTASHTVNGNILTLKAGTSSEAEMVMDSGAGLNVNLRWRQNGVNRWNLYLDGGTSALNFYNNTAVTSFGNISSTGAWTLGPSSGLAGTHVLRSADTKALTGAGHVAIFDTRTQATGVGGLLTFSGYKTGTSAIGYFGAIGGFKENSTDGSELGSLKFYTNNNTALVDVGTISSAGGWSLGPASSNNLHLIRGNLRVTAGTEYTGAVTNVSNFTSKITITSPTGSTNAKGFIGLEEHGGGGGAGIVFSRGSSFDTAIDFYTNTTSGAATGNLNTLAGSISSAGQWSLGPTSLFGTIEHRVRGSVRYESLATLNNIGNVFVNLLDISSFDGSYMLIGFGNENNVNRSTVLLLLVRSTTDNNATLTTVSRADMGNSFGHLVYQVSGNNLQVRHTNAVNSLISSCRLTWQRLTI